MFLSYIITKKAKQGKEENKDLSSSDSKVLSRFESISDVQNDTDALYCQFQICHNEVQDLQVTEFINRQVRRKVHLRTS